ncbi:hypothetical protein [Kitasatospora sp. NPDC088548]|uniref:hypothetical protein n=1 Tax=Kitasatospora sp. NPDC088548 TaxID=3364075 RepID=UPI0037F23BF5
MHVAPAQPAIPPANTLGLRWLAGFHPDPPGCLDAWAAGGLADIPLQHLSVVRVSATLGIRACRQLDPIGPVLHSVRCGVVEFVVAPTSMTWSLSGVGELVGGGVLSCPPPGRALPVRGAPYWLVDPDGVGRLMDITRVIEALHNQYQHFVREDERPANGGDTGPGPRTQLPAAAFLAGVRRAGAGV